MRIVEVLIAFGVYMICETAARYFRRSLVDVYTKNRRNKRTTSLELSLGFY
jgi:hypothetical protein